MCRRGSSRSMSTTMLVEKNGECTTRRVDDVESPNGGTHGGTRRGIGGEGGVGEGIYEPEAANESLSSN